MDCPEVAASEKNRDEDDPDVSAKYGGNEYASGPVHPEVDAIAEPDATAEPGNGCDDEDNLEVDASSKDGRDKDNPDVEASAERGHDEYDPDVGASPGRDLDDGDFKVDAPAEEEKVSYDGHQV